MPAAWNEYVFKLICTKTKNSGGVYILATPWVKCENTKIDFKIKTMLLEKSTTLCVGPQLK